MTASAYCQPADLYDHGLPRGALPNPGRLVDAVGIAANTLTLEGHGFAEDAELVFRAEEGGSLPSPLVAGTTYYAKPLTDSTFQVAASAGGAAIDLTTAGASVIVVTPLPVQAWIEWASALIDDMLPAHAVPLTAPYPVTVVTVCATLAAQKGLAYTGQAQKPIETLIAWAQDRVKAWVKGVPVRGATMPASASLAVRGSFTAGDPRGWSPTGGTLP